jgi:glycosyltransferase involved in cell wall biosynthesis
LYHKITILCFVNWYLPGFRAGGPIQTVANFAEHLGEEFDIHIVCCDRDANDDDSYQNIKVDAWNIVGKTKVFYASPKTISFKGIKKILKETPHNILYINSVFTYGFSILPLFVRLLNFNKTTPCIIGPRGEFSRGALSIKTLKKKFFLFLSKVIGLHNNLYWQASSKLELADIQNNYGDVAKKIVVARDLTPSNLILKDKIFPKRVKGPLRIIFLSRISPMKNLDFLLSVLSKISKDVEFNIFGPKDDIPYWNKCKIFLSELPKNIKVNIGDEVPHKNVHNVFSHNDLFAFPTKGEALGHIILESLSAATPVLVSDKTSWISDNQKGLQAISLNKNDWIRAINDWVNISDDEIIFRRKAALNYANKAYLDNLKSIDDNKKLFYKASMRDK